MIGLTTANQTFLASGKRGFPVFGAGFGKINSEIFPDDHAREPYTFAFRRYASDAVLTVEIVPQPNSCGLEVVRNLAVGPRASDKSPWIAR